MLSPMKVEYREATQRDVEAIARLHADSWRRNYRGSYSDAYLDGDVGADRLAVWTDRFASPSGRDDQITIVAARDAVIVGFAHTILHHNRELGALLDNLHVAHDLKGHGIGTQLVVETARAVIERTPSSSLYLWVLERNTAAQAFYRALGGTFAGQETSEAPGGGAVLGLRVVWRDPSRLARLDRTIKGF